MDLQITQNRHPKSFALGWTNGWSGHTTRPGFCQGRTWFSCSLYSFYSGHKSRTQEHLCWSPPAYSIFLGGVDRTVMWPVPKQDGQALPSLYWHIFLSFPIGSDNYSYWKIWSLVKGIESTCIFVILSSSYWQSDCDIFFTIQRAMAWFTPEYSSLPVLLVLDGCSGVLHIL